MPKRIPRSYFADEGVLATAEIPGAVSPEELRVGKNPFCAEISISASLAVVMAVGGPLITGGGDLHPSV